MRPLRKGAWDVRFLGLATPPKNSKTHSPRSVLLCPHRLDNDRLRPAPSPLHRHPDPGQAVWRIRPPLLPDVPRPVVLDIVDTRRYVGNIGPVDGKSGRESLVLQLLHHRLGVGRGPRPAPA